jgi:diguanylate cyclase (GGDEF)-like protein
MVVARLGIFTPALLLIIVVAHSRRSYRLRETLAVVGAVLAVVLPMTVMIFSESPRMLSYQYGSLLVMMFATVVQRVRFRFAVIGLGLMLAVQAIATYASGAFDAETYQTIVIVFATAAALFSATAYYLEQADRRQFLLARRGELLREELARSARPAAGDARIVSAILIDIDHFKRFNDSRGHLEGDTCLRRLSACIARVAQEQQGLAFRYGGEEMLVLLPDVELGEACATARAIHEAIRATAIPHPALGEAATVGASLGVAGAFIATTTASALIAAADTALYAAKRAGRNQVWPPLGLAPMQREAVEASHAALRQTG